jgi:hypothetical protein
LIPGVLHHTYESIGVSIMSKEIRPTALPGLAGIGLITTGIAGIIHAFLSGGSLSLVASGISFGIVFYVCFK